MTAQQLREQGLTEQQAGYVMDAWERAARQAAVDRGMERYRFSSLSAREAVRRRVAKAKLPLEGGELQGLEELMESIRREDPDAFVAGEPPVRFTAALCPGPAPTREQIIKIPDRARRRAAIAENMRLFKGAD